MDIDAFFADFPALETDRLALRQLGPDDVAAATAFFGDREVGWHTTWLGMVERQGLAGFFAFLGRATADRKLAIWGIVPKETGCVIGFASLYPIEPDHGRGELGYALARPYWGRGYAREAVRAVVDCAFTQLDCHRIEAFTSVENAASSRVLEQLGFRIEGVLREHTVIRGAPRDRAVYAILRSEWQAERDTAVG